MPWQWTPFIIPLLITAALSVGAAAFILWKRRHLPASRVSVLLLAGGIVWMLASVMQLASTGLEAKICWEKVQFVGMCVIPTAWLAYALHYTGHDSWLTARNRVLLALSPLFAFLLALTNKAHDLIWRDAWLDASGPYVIKQSPYGLGMWLYVAYAYVLVLIGVVLILRTLSREGRLYRWQAGLVLVAVLAPWLANIIEQAVGLPVVGDMELTPLVLGLTIPFVAWSFHRLQMRDLVPVARDTVVDSMPDALLVLDNENCIVDLNPAAEGLLGLPRSEALRQPLEALRPEWLTAMDGDPHSSHEATVEQGGEQHTFDLRIAPLTGWSGRVLSHVLVLHDITERMRAERALRDSEEQYRLLAENARDAIWTTDLDLNFTYASPSIYHLGGLTPEEILGRNVRTMLTRTSLQTAVQALADELGKETSPDRPEPNRSLVLELDQLVKGDSPIPVEARVSFLRDSAGQPYGLLGITRDITERRRAEEQANRYAAELERSNRELKQFAYVASHDLQEPLRTVTSYVQLLERRYKGQLDADADDFIHFAVDGARRMHELIHGLLAYSRVSTEGQPLEQIESQKVVEQVLYSLQAAIEESQAEVTHDALPVIMADATQLSQVFQNLIGNALKFKGEDPPAIHIAADRQAGEWLFSVRDNGIGMEEQYADRIFVIFQRLHTLDEYSGTGIGLAVCKRIIDRHGGRIWVESEPGQGAAFFFTIPETNGQK